MPLGNIATLKENSPVAYKPLILVTVNFQDNPTSPTIAYWSTDPLNVADGGYQYNSQDYQPRIINQDAAATQAMSDQGIDMPVSVTIDIADPDNSIYNNYELTTGLGFKGAIMTLTFVLWDADTANFSTDSTIKFVGRCGAAEVIDDSTIRVTAYSKMNLSQTQLPSIHVQGTCPWLFPLSPSDRDAAATSDDSPSWECGYSPDAVSNPIGNFFAQTTLSGSITASQTNITVAAAIGLTVPYSLVLGTGASREAVIVLNQSGTSLTVARGAQGTLGVSHGSGTAANAPYPPCNLTRFDCMNRLGDPTKTNVAPDGDIMHDRQGRLTGHFGGILWSPPASGKSRGYISGKWQEIINNSNQAKYGDLIPMCYGDTWVTPLILDVTGDANYTSCQVLLTYGQVQFIYDVLVNNVRIPHVNNDTVLSQVPGELVGGNIGGGFWGCIAGGGRSGGLNTNPFYGGFQDPHGSMCVIQVQVPVQLAAANSLPDIQVRLRGQPVRVYTTPTTYTRTYSDNPVWILLDTLIWSGYTIGTDIDVASFIAAAAKCAEQINFTNINNVVTNLIPSDLPYGGTVPYTKWAVSMALRQRRSAADIVKGLRNGCGALLIPNYGNGKLRCRMKETLASQQPSPVQLNGVNASNNNTPISSLTVDGSVANGYPAYAFDESNIIRDRNGKPIFKLQQKPFSQTPNSLSATFQDQENKGSWDSLNLVDTEDFGYIDQTVNGTQPIDGPNTFDRARRALALFQAENYRGNPRLSIQGEVIGDTKGTAIVEFDTSYQAIHLNVGDIILLNYQQRNISNWLMRILSIKAGLNAGTITIRCSYHNDYWYLNQYGQANRPLWTSGHRSTQDRLAQAWAPGTATPGSGDALFWSTDQTFNISQQYVIAADGTLTTDILIQGKLPVNGYAPVPDPPFVGSQASTSSTGGSILGGYSYFFRIAGKVAPGSTYQTGATSELIRVYVPVGTNTNTITLPILNWSLATNGYAVYGGKSPNMLSYQLDVDAPNVTVTAATLAANAVLTVSSTSGFTPGQPVTISGASVAGWNVNCTVVSVGTGTITVSLNSTGFTPWSGSGNLAQNITVSGTPSIVLTSYNEKGSPMPDNQFDHIGVYSSLVYHGGVMGTTIASCTSTSITITPQLLGGVLGTNQFAGYVVSLVGMADTSRTTGSPYPLPIFNANISTNSGNTLNLGAGLDGTIPDPTKVPRGDGTLGLQAGDVVYIRTSPTYGSDGNGSYMDDPGWKNYANQLLTPGFAVTAVTNATNCQVTTATAHGFAIGDTIYLNFINGMTGFPQFGVVQTTPSGTTFTLNINTTSSGTYTGSGGVAIKQVPGFSVAPTVTAATNALPAVLTVSSSAGLVAGGTCTLAAGPSGWAGNYQIQSIAGNAVTIALDSTSLPAWSGTSPLYLNVVQGFYARAIAGTGRGMEVKLASNTSTRIYIEGSFPVQPDSSTIWTIHDPNWIDQAEGISVNNSNPNTLTSLRVNLDNYKGKQVMFKGVAIDGDMSASLDSQNPVREIYLFGQVASFPPGSISVQVNHQ